MLLEAVLGKIIARILVRLTHLVYLVEEEREIYLAEGATDPDDVMTPLQAAAAHYRIAQGPRAGQKIPMQAVSADLGCQILLGHRVRFNSAISSLSFASSLCSGAVAAAISSPVKRGVMCCGQFQS